MITDNQMEAAIDFSAVRIALGGNSLPYKVYSAIPDLFEAITKNASVDVSSEDMLKFIFHKYGVEYPS